ncbi:phosphotyrosine protein phosphatase [Aurantiacibacter suaedae]|uniref:arsenate reductase/protein-tyrosine-phosphatase family protein n=1 Tax=Aurantiacibacter suaedae TaxID=2545755 RepID=UPI0010F85DB1|nr:phosphotyrosine protein phosphatase [Aurantiacibacter suaedae]
MQHFIASNFGTSRGAVRLALSYLEVASGFDGQHKIALREARRLVFVCHGNICRSAYADVVGRKAGLEVASFGLSTATGKMAHPLVIEEAGKRGIDLSAHRTTAKEDFAIKEGDYLLAMETRHLRKMLSDPAFQATPMALLGTYARPPFPHLHDPYKLAPEYLPTCLNRIEESVRSLARQWERSRA